jgi:FkbM family methyltransferase
MEPLANGTGRSTPISTSRSKYETDCILCRLLGELRGLPYRAIRKLYKFIFARPSMQFANDNILALALHGRGYLNCCSPKATGEELFIKRLARFGPKLCVDVGANGGDYSKTLLEYTSAKVIAFEPLPKAYAKLAKVGEAFPGRLVAVNQGVADKTGVLNLHFGDEDSELASFSSEVGEIEYVGLHNRNVMLAKVTSLDDYFATVPRDESLEIDLIKIDTEGYEYEVLLGSRNIIESQKPRFIQIEFNWHQLFRNQSLWKLASHMRGYIPYQLLPYGSGVIRRDPKAPETNIFNYSTFIFVRDDVSI